MKVEEIMTSAPVIVRPDTPVIEIARLLIDRAITGVPVVDAANRVVGIITDADLIVRQANIRFPRYIQLLDSILYLESTREYEQELRKFLGTTASEVMSSPAVTVTPETEVGDLAELMFDKRVNPVPVVDSRGHLRGIVSRADLVKLIARQTPEEAGPSA